MGWYESYVQLVMKQLKEFICFIKQRKGNIMMEVMNFGNFVVVMGVGNL